MKLITRDTDYALRVVSYLAKNKNKQASVSELVKALKIPRPFLRKILQALSKKGIFRSSKGQGGGFLLLKKPAKIFLVDLMQAFQGELKLNECFFKKMPCPNIKKCSLRKKIDKIERYLINELSTITVMSLLR